MPPGQLARGTTRHHGFGTRRACRAEPRVNLRQEDANRSLPIVDRQTRIVWFAGAVHGEGCEVRFTLRTRWSKTCLSMLALAASSFLLAGCFPAATQSACGPGVGTHRPGASSGATALTPAGASPPTSLPPSHDNDAGRGRIPDVHPDADVDANQRPVACPALR
jgi:hypothetical protein